MKTQIRHGVFETNSSSTHAISIIQNSDVNKYPNTVMFKSGEFGWEYNLYNDTVSKASYLYQAIVSCARTVEDFKTYEKKISDILERYGIVCCFECEEPFMKKSDWNPDYEYLCCRSDGYIDHGDDTLYFLNNVTSDDIMLLNYLFDSNSYVSTGNDNDDQWLKVPDYGPSWFFEKGN